jgi:hypothetical protein
LTACGKGDLCAKCPKWACCAGLPKPYIIVVCKTKRDPQKKVCSVCAFAVCVGGRTCSTDYTWAPTLFLYKCTLLGGDSPLAPRRPGGEGTRRTSALAAERDGELCVHIIPPLEGGGFKGYSKWSKTTKGIPQNPQPPKTGLLPVLAQAKLSFFASLMGAAPRCICGAWRSEALRAVGIATWRWNRTSCCEPQCRGRRWRSRHFSDP